MSRSRRPCGVRAPAREAGLGRREHRARYLRDGSARAVLIAESLIESVGGGWSWEGWDLALAVVNARPA